MTKGALILRDLDLLRAFAEQELVAVHVSVTTLDDELKRRMEPRTAGPKQRLAMIRSSRPPASRPASWPRPIIPALNDHELESILEAAAENGARQRRLRAAAPAARGRAAVRRVAARALPRPRRARAEPAAANARRRACTTRQFGSRQRGFGPFAALLKARFAEGAPPLRARARGHAAHATYSSPPRHCSGPSSTLGF